MRLRRKILPLAALGLLASWIAAHAQQSGAPPRTRNSQVVLTDTEAFVLGPAEMIAGPEVNVAGMSADGRYILATRAAFDMPAVLPPSGPPSGEISLLLWNSRTRRSNIVWKSALSERRFAGVNKVAWLPGTDVALASVGVEQVSANQEHQTRYSLLLINAASAATRTIAALTQDDELHVSPVHPVAAVLGHAEMLPKEQPGQVTARRQTLHIIGAKGSIGPATRLPALSSVAGFSSDGSSVYIATLVKPTEMGKRYTENWYAVAVRTGALSPLTKRPQLPDAYEETLSARIAALPVRVKSGAGTLKEGNSTLSLRPLWLESAVKSETPRALLASDADSGLVLPNGQTALYQSQGALYAVPLLRMDKTAFLEARQKAQQAATISNAKQIGTALAMYVQDYDEVYPSANDAINNQILPYIKNEAVFKNPATDSPGFVYTYAGGPLSAITDASETLIGYVTGPGGRALIYADGHVVWKPY